MYNSRTRILQLTFVLFLFFGIRSLATAQEPASADNSWLNGKWQGTPPMGGTYLMDLEVYDGDKVKGSGKLQNVKKAVTGEITGTVDKTKVRLEAHHTNVNQSNTVKYRLDLKDGVLTGKAGLKDTTFTKVE